jgi:hypothetical protein
LQYKGIGRNPLAALHLDKPPKRFCKPQVRGSIPLPGSDGNRGPARSQAMAQENSLRAIVYDNHWSLQGADKPEVEGDEVVL